MKNVTILRYLIIIMCIVMMSSCSYTPHSPDDSDTGSSTVQTEYDPPESEAETDETVHRYGGNPDYPVLAEAYLGALPQRDYNGATFIITSTDTTFFDENEVRYVSEAVHKRNSMVEEKFNIKLQSAKSDTITMIEDAKKSALAGMYYTDIMCIPMSEVGTFNSEGLLMNLRSLPHLDLSAPYFNSTSASALSAGYKVLGIAGEAVPVTDLPCIIYNKKLASSVGAGDLYTIAESGEFTWDKLLQLTSLCKADSGAVGATISGGETYDYMFASLGEHFISSAEMSVPEVAILRNSMDWTATYARPMLQMASNAGITKEDAVKAFSEGKALFTVGTVGDLDSYRNTDVLVGVLPMPKLNKEESYRSAVGSDALIMTVPDGATNSEMTSLVLSAINAASFGYITETSASYLHATTLPDNRSADMLEIISRGAVYDFSTAFETVVPSIADLKNVVRGIIENGDFSLFDNTVYNVNRDLAASFPLVN